MRIPFSVILQAYQALSRVHNSDNVSFPDQCACSRAYGSLTYYLERTTEDVEIDIQRSEEAANTKPN